MDYIVMNDETKYTISADGENQELNSQIIKAMEIFYGIEEEYNQIQAQYEEAKTKMELMFGKGFDEYGLKSIKSRYVNATYIPEGKPTVKKKLNEKALDELFDELGVAKDDYYIETEVKGRKAYVRWGNK